MVTRARSWYAKPITSTASERGQQAFLEEAKALARCDHACLMRVLRVLECHGTVYKVMPYCPRDDAARAPADDGCSANARVVAYLARRPVGRVGSMARGRPGAGAVSPGNILMLSDDRPVLLDSDAVHVAILSDRTRSMIAALEPCFAPQEQCEPAPERPLGPWTDLYALAATLRFCVSGQLPGTFAQRPRGACFSSAGRHQPSAGEAVGAFGPDCWAALDSCLAESGKDRPQSVAQLTRLLDIDKPTARAGMDSGTAGLAPLLSSPVVKPSAPVAHPARTRPENTAPDAEAEMPGASQVERQASHGVAQLPLPWVLPRPAGASTLDDATADGAASPA